MRIGSASARRSAGSAAMGAVDPPRHHCGCSRGSARPFRGAARAAAGFAGPASADLLRSPLTGRTGGWPVRSTRRGGAVSSSRCASRTRPSRKPRSVVGTIRSGTAAHRRGTRAARPARRSLRPARRRGPTAAHRRADSACRSTRGTSGEGDEGTCSRARAANSPAAARSGITASTSRSASRASSSKGVPASVRRPTAGAVACAGGMSSGGRVRSGPGRSRPSGPVRRGPEHRTAEAR